MFRIGIVLLAAALVAGFAVTTAQTGNAGADLCKGDFAQWRRIDGTSFGSQGACNSYVVHGGTLAKFTTSTSSHVSTTRVELPTVQVLSTRVVGSYSGSSVYDQTTPHGPQSAEVNSMFSQARAAVLSEFAQRPEGHTDGFTVSIIGPTLVSTTQLSSETVLVSSESDHTETSSEQTITFEPNGTARINTHTHTEEFVEETYQTTVSTRHTYAVAGYLAYG